MNYYSSAARATRGVIYVLAVVVPVVIALAVVGSTPSLLDKVPEQHRDTVAAFGEGAERLSGGNGGIFGAGDAHAVGTTIPGRRCHRTGSGRRGAPRTTHRRQG